MTGDSRVLLLLHTHTHTHTERESHSVCVAFDYLECVCVCSRLLNLVRAVGIVLSRSSVILTIVAHVVAWRSCDDAKQMANWFST
jgi:hypothetical protein